ncbi:hypothetical protein Fmac_020079 [Flemingia macrophylla]|uniref:Mediator complex subunit 15 KIX domain-containing protein n=1 Tax=Flemingia macrophylla TaxID=520843 RepID=A0ABD1M9M4_9FABA
MDTNNWKPNQGSEDNMDNSDWRSGLHPDSRQRIVNKIMDTLKRHLPVYGQEGLLELRKIAQRFEYKIFTAATSQSDYLRKISLKMLTMETKSQGNIATNIPPNQGDPSHKPPDPAPGLVIPPQVHNPGQQHPIPMPSQTQTCQQLLSQNIQNNIAFQTSSLDQTAIQNVGQNNPNMQKIPGQNSVGSNMGQNSNMQNMFAGLQRQIQGRQEVVPQQQQQQLQNPQQNNLSNLQQQLLINQQNNLSNSNIDQQLGKNVPGLQPQQVRGPQPSNSGMQTSQHSAHVLQQLQVPIQLQSQQNASSLLTSQEQQSQPQAPQQQLMPPIQSQPAQLQHQFGLQQQPNSLQQDIQQRFQASGSLLQQPSVLDQQKLTSSTSLDSTAQTGQSSGGDWQEELYQKIKSMKESYLPELHEIYQKFATKLQQHESLPQQPQSDQLVKLKVFKMMLDRIINFLQLPKSSISPNFKEKLGSYEKQIINFINTDRPRKTMPGQLPPPRMHSMSQSQTQITQVLPHENQMNSQLQTTNMQSSVATIQQNNLVSMQHNSLSGVPTTQQSKLNSMLPSTNLDSGPGNAMNSLQLVPVSSLQQNSVITSQQTNAKSLSSQAGVNGIQPNLDHRHPGSSILQQQELLESQQLKQQYQQQIMQWNVQQQQQLHQAAKQQLATQLPTDQMQQLLQMNDANEIKMRQGIGVKPGIFLQHLTSSQRSAYPHQQFKGSPYPVTSPQLLQATSQIPQHSSPQVYQQNHLPSLTKVVIPLQSANLPFVVPTPSPPLASSPMAGDSEKPMSGVSSISNAANIGYQHIGGASAPAQSLAIGTPGISATPLLSEFTGLDGTHGNALAPTSGKSTVTMVMLMLLLMLLLMVLLMVLKPIWIIVLGEVDC